MEPSDLGRSCRTSSVEERTTVPVIDTRGLPDSTLTSSHRSASPSPYPRVGGQQHLQGVQRISGEPGAEFLRMTATAV